MLYVVINIQNVYTYTRFDIYYINYRLSTIIKLLQGYTFSTGHLILT